MSYVDMKVIQVQECVTVDKLVPDDSAIADAKLTAEDYSLIADGMFAQSLGIDTSGGRAWTGPGFVTPGYTAPPEIPSEVPIPAAGLLFGLAVVAALTVMNLRRIKRWLS